MKMEQKKINWESFQEKFHISWREKLKPFFETEECYNILAELTKEAKARKTVLPGRDYLWRVFQYDFNKINILFLGLSPYFTVGIPDGLAFSCSRTMKEQPSLSILFNCLEQDLGYKDDRNCDLHRWAEQGVMLLNASLSTLPNDAKCHLSLWNPFITYLFKEVFKDKELAIIYFGSDAKVFQQYENKELHKSYVCKHPSYYARNNSQMTEKPFSFCNNYLKSVGKPEIKWQDFNKTLIFEGDKEYEEFI